MNRLVVMDVFKAHPDDPGYEPENDKEKQKAKSKIDDIKKKKKIEDKDKVDLDKDKGKNKKSKNEKKDDKKSKPKKKDDKDEKEPKKDGTYQTSIKKQLIGSMGNLLSLRERAHKLMEEFFSRSNDKEKKPKNVKTAEKEEEKSKALISAVTPLVVLKLSDVLEKALDNEHFKIDRSDECIWLTDKRGKKRIIHLVPEQAKEIGSELLSISKLQKSTGFRMARPSKRGEEESVSAKKERDASGETTPKQERMRELGRRRREEQG